MVWWVKLIKALPLTPVFFSTSRNRQFFFLCASVVWYVAFFLFCYCLLLSPHSFGASVMLCFVTCICWISSFMFFVSYNWIFQQTIGILMGTNCTVTCRFVFILVWGGVCTKSPPSRQETPRTTIQFHLQIYRWGIVSEKHKICRVFRIHLSTWTWNKGNNGDCSLILILGLLFLHWQWKASY